MTEPTQYWLVNDVVSHFAPYEVYGKAGTEVVILHDHLDMMIVQDKEGNKFHSRTDNLTSEKPKPATPTPPKAEDPPTKVPPTRKKKTSFNNQSNLF